MKMNTVRDFRIERIRKRQMDMAPPRVGGDGREGVRRAPPGAQGAHALGVRAPRPDLRVLGLPASYQPLQCSWLHLPARREGELGRPQVVVRFLLVRQPMSLAQGRTRE